MKIYLFLWSNIFNYEIPYFSTGNCFKFIKGSLAFKNYEKKKKNLIPWIELVNIAMKINEYRIDKCLFKIIQLYLYLI